MPTKKKTNPKSTQLATPAQLETAAKTTLHTFAALPALPAKITSEEEYTQVGKYLKTDKELLKQLEAQKEEIITPFAKALEKLYSKQRAIRKPIEEHSKKVKSLLNAWVEKKRAEEVKKAQRKAARLIEKGDEEQAEAVIAVAQETRVTPKVEGTRTVTRWTYKVTDESKIPIEFGGVTIRPVDARMLKHFAKLKEEAPTIPGVEFFPETIVQ